MAEPTTTTTTTTKRRHSTFAVPPLPRSSSQAKKASSGEKQQQAGGQQQRHHHHHQNQNIWNSSRSSLFSRRDSLPASTATARTAAPGRGVAAGTSAEKAQRPGAAARASSDGGEQQQRPGEDRRSTSVDVDSSVRRDLLFEDFDGSDDETPAADDSDRTYYCCARQPDRSGPAAASSSSWTEPFPLRELSNDSDAKASSSAAAAAAAAEEVSSPSRRAPRGSNKRTSSATKRRRRSVYFPPPQRYQERQQQQRGAAGWGNATAAATSNKRRKRHSIFLPPRSEDLRTSSGSAPPSAAADDYDDGPPRWDGLPSLRDVDAVRGAVRAYTAMSEDEKWSRLNNDREDSPTTVIREISGYELSKPGPRPAGLATRGGGVGEDGFVVTRSPIHTRAGKMRVLCGLGDLHSLDGCKVRDAEVAERVTGCRVEKVVAAPAPAPGRNGALVRYVHKSTNTRVAPRRYEQLYANMLEEVAGERSRKWKDYFDALRRQDAEQQRRREDRMEIDEPGIDFVSPADDVVGPGESATDANEKDGANDVQIFDIDSVSPADDVLGPGELATDSNEKDGANDEQTFDIDSVSPEPPSAPPSFSPVQPPTPADANAGTLLLPLPSRDETSSDPEIARVEQKLWERIDAALEEYSNEVLSIQESRRRRGFLEHKN